MIPHANLAKQFLDAPLNAPPGQQQLSDIHRKMPPADDLINTFMEVTGGAVGRDLAIKFLEGANNDIENAMNDYWTNSNKYDASYQGWDASQFSADRDGGTGDAGIPSFTIDAGEDGGVYPGSSSAPTRPPSRRSNYSTRSTGQENGVINSLGQDQTGRQYFGPMTQDAAAYVPEQWAMVPISSSVRVYDNPDPTERQRNKENGEPVCFKPTREKDALPCLMTVLGQIPIARKELLRGEVEMDTYGGNDKWWDGDSAMAGQPRLLDDAELPQEQVVAEAQRLMAFVQESNRSYGSVEALNNLEGISNDTTGQILRKEGATYSGELRFMVGWSSAAEMFQASHQQSSSDMFQTIMVANEVKNGFKEESSDIIYRLDLGMSTSEPKQSLYQAIDESIWANDPRGDADEEYYIEKVAPILVMRVQNHHTANDAKGLGLKVPISFYADRYVKDNYAILKEMRQSKEALRQQVYHVGDRKKKLEQTTHPRDSTKTLGREELFDKTIEYLRKKDKPPVTKAPKKDADEVMEGQEPIIRTAWDDLADKLEKYHAKLQNKLKDLDDHRAKLEEQMASLSNILTENDTTPNREINPQPTQSYTLRGIGIGPAYETTFVYVDPIPQTEPSAMEADGQWWRFEFTAHGSWTPPTKKPVSEAEVLAEAGDESKEALLIYASNAACDTREFADAVLNHGLRAFVNADQEAFKQELREHEQQQDHPPQQQPRDQETEEEVAGPDDWPAVTTVTTVGVDVDEPPPYSSASASTQHVENAGVALSSVEDDADQWVEDLGPGLISDEDYVANTRYAGVRGGGSGRGVSTEMTMGGTRYDGTDDTGKKDDAGINHW